MRSLPSLLSVLLAATAAQGAVIAQWNFNGGSAATVPGGSSSPTTFIGNGSAALIGSASGTFADGTTDGRSSDPITIAPSNYAWNTTTYGPAGNQDLSNGVRFHVSTVGYTGITLSFDLRTSGTASRYAAVQYTSNGTTWTTADFVTANAGDTWFKQNTFNLSSITAVNDNTDFGIRIVAAWESTATGAGANNLVAANTGSTYGSTGTWRFDMVTINGVPEPSCLILASFSSSILLRRRRSIS
jgi:hypothetical protein